MSKYSGAALVLAVFAGLFLSFRIQRRTWAETFKVSTIVLCAAAVVAAPFLLRNAVEFNSDFLGTGTMQKTWAEAYGRTEVPTLSPAQLLKQRLWWYQMFTSFFGVFGYQSRYLAAPFYALYFLFVLLSVSGPAASFVFKGDGNGGKAQEPMRLVWFTLILAVVFNFASLVAASCLNVGGPQGRYLLPSELAIVALMLAGLDRLPERISRAAVVSLTLFNAAASVSSLIVLYRLFGFVGRPY